MAIVQTDLEPNVVFGNRKVREAVAVQVCGEKSERFRGRKVSSPFTKLPVPVPSNWLILLGEHIRDHQIGDAVAVHVGHGDIERLLAVEWVGRGCLEMAIAFAQRNGHGVRLHVGECNIEIAVAVEVGDREPAGILSAHYLDRILKGAVAITEGDRNGATRFSCSHSEIEFAIAVESAAATALVVPENSTAILF